MDYETIFWLVLAGLGLIFTFFAMNAPYDEPVSRDTIRRVCGERIH